MKARIEGAADGPLKGKTVAIKDSACVAGIPMMNGASVLEGYVPDIDATVVTRLLDAGATILGKSVCEYSLRLGRQQHVGLGHRGKPAQSRPYAGRLVHRERGSGRLRRGSTWRSAATRRARSVSRRRCRGIVGIKPTFGLIPYTGIMGIETTVDHTGPMTENVADNALFLESMAGEDGLDPRQRVPNVDSYTDALGGDVRGMRVAVVSEGFGRYDSLPDVDATVRAGRQAARIAGARRSPRSRSRCT